MPLFLTDNFSRFFPFCKKHKRGSLIFILPLLSISVFIINPCFAAVNSEKEPVVTIAIKNEPLRVVLDKISTITGYKIEVTEGWDSKPITVDIQGMTLDESLKKIIRVLGSPNNAKIDYKSKRVIRINFFDTPKDILITQTNNNFSQLQAKQAEAVLNIENFPPIEDTKITKDTASKIDPLDIEVLPPNKPGEKGITQREILKMRGEKKELNPLDMEILPPKNPGEKGVTQRELQAVHGDRGKVSTTNIEVLPPKNIE
jgi:hypothetical protein